MIPLFPDGVEAAFVSPAVANWCVWGKRGFSGLWGEELSFGLLVVTGSPLSVGLYFFSF
jgi:hypothetical protein